MPLRILEHRVFGRELNIGERAVLRRAAKVVSIIVLPLLVLGLLVPIGASFWFVEREARQQSAVVEKESKARDAAVEYSRAQITYTTCLDQNARHDEILRRLDTVLRRAVRREPGRKAALRATRASTVFLINGIAPRQNCERLVRSRFGFVPNGPPNPAARSG